jgi:hypothetical protein
MDENITLVGYNSKKQCYIVLGVSILMLIIGVFWIFFAEGNKKFASIAVFLIGIGFMIVFFNLLKLPHIGIKVINDKYLYFYDKDDVKIIDICDVEKVNYWPANYGLKIVLFTSKGSEYFTYLLTNIKEVKKHLLYLFEKQNIKVINRYSK